MVSGSRGSATLSANHLAAIRLQGYTLFARPVLHALSPILIIRSVYLVALVVQLHCYPTDHHTYAIDNDGLCIANVRVYHMSGDTNQIPVFPASYWRIPHLVL